MIDLIWERLEQNHIKRSQWVQTGVSMDIVFRDIVREAEELKKSGFIDHICSQNLNNKSENNA